MFERNIDIPKYEIIKKIRNDKIGNKNLKRNLFSVFVTIVVTVSICAILSLLLFPIEKIDGNNLSPFLNNDDIILLMKKPHYNKGDLICFGYGNLTLCKRIVAEQGDFVNFDEKNNLYVNDKLINESDYIINNKSGDYENIYPIQVPDDSYFVLSDNREIVTDSRAKYISFVKNDSIIGKAILKLYPFDEIKLL